MTVGERIKRIREKQKIAQIDLANAVKITKQNLYKYENDIITNIPSDKIEAISDYLGVSPSYLMGWDDNLKPPGVTEEIVTFPVIGEIAAGYDCPAIEDWSGDTMDVPITYLHGRPQSDFFVLKVKGDSMYPEYQNGDKVLILKQPSLNYSGQIGAIMYDNEMATLKRVEYKKGENWMRLVPINPIFMPEKIEGVDLEQCRVLGIPKLLIREVEQ